MYKLIFDIQTGAVTCIKRIADNAFIPMDQANTDYQEYLAWLSSGNVPLPPDEVAGTSKEIPDAD